MLSVVEDAQQWRQQAYAMAADIQGLRAETSELKATVVHQSNQSEQQKEQAVKQEGVIQQLKSSAVKQEGVIQQLKSSQRASAAKLKRAEDNISSLQSEASTLRANNAEQADTINELRREVSGLLSKVSNLSVQQSWFQEQWLGFQDIPLRSLREGWRARLWGHELSVEDKQHFDGKLPQLIEDYVGKKGFTGEKADLARKALRMLAFGNKEQQRGNTAAHQSDIEKQAYSVSIRQQLKEEYTFLFEEYHNKSLDSCVFVPGGFWSAFGTCLDQCVLPSTACYVLLGPSHHVTGIK
jgi:hypothetical protein